MSKQLIELQRDLIKSQDELIKIHKEKETSDAEIISLLKQYIHGLENSIVQYKHLLKQYDTIVKPLSTLN